MAENRGCLRAFRSTPERRPAHESNRSEMLLSTGLTCASVAPSGLTLGTTPEPDQGAARSIGMFTELPVTSCTRFVRARSESSTLNATRSETSGGTRYPPSAPTASCDGLLAAAETRVSRRSGMPCRAWKTAEANCAKDENVEVLQSALFEVAKTSHHISRSLIWWDCCCDIRGVARRLSKRQGWRFYRPSLPRAAEHPLHSGDQRLDSKAAHLRCWIRADVPERDRLIFKRDTRVRFHELRYSADVAGKTPTRPVPRAAGKNLKRPRVPLRSAATGRAPLPPGGADAAQRGR